MKTIFFFFALIVVVSCKNNSETSSANNSATNTAPYAYTIAHPDQWEWGDKNNIRIALDGLKAYERGNISAAFKDYADTVLIQMDGFERRLSKDSLLSLFLRERSGIRRLGIEMNDFVSLRSKDGKSEYVSLWYKQLWEDQTGKIDSIECMDDLAFRNGKIILWNEKVRRYPGYSQE
ncbi:MAG: hypothetical protein JWR18_3061 [Segetibacter sp.]|jgi:hypothetical protein|nr:hypothetical protein [Segetibacter sp.]